MTGRHGAATHVVPVVEAQSPSSAQCDEHALGCALL